jgi:hypothetical protein
MAATVAQVTTPNGPQTWLQFGPFKAVIVDVTLDSTYPTTGEVVTAAQVSLDTIVGCITVREFANAAGTLTIGPTRMLVNAAGTQFTIQGYNSTTGAPSTLLELANNFNASTYVGRLMVFGY